MFDKQLSTQSIREMLLANKKFPKSIMITAEFVRNMKLYIKQHNILPDMPDTEVDRMVNMDAYSALEYEDVMISSELLNSSALASRAARKDQVSDLLTFLNYIQAKDPMFSFKVSSQSKNHR